MNSMILDSDYYYIEYEATDEDEVLETGEFANEMVVEKDKIEAEIDSIQVCVTIAEGILPFANQLPRRTS